MSAVLGIRRKEIWQEWMRAFNVGRLAQSVKREWWACRTKTHGVSDAAMDDNAPSQRVFVGDVDWVGLIKNDGEGRDLLGQRDDRHRADPPAYLRTVIAKFRC